MRNPRRAYDREGHEIEPMTLGNMRQHGVRSVDATCEACGHEAVIDVDALPMNLCAGRGTQAPLLGVRLEEDYRASELGGAQPYGKGNYPNRPKG